MGFIHGLHGFSRIIYRPKSLGLFTDYTDYHGFIYHPNGRFRANFKGKALEIGVNLCNLWRNLVVKKI